MNSNFTFKDHAQTHQQQLHRHQRQRQQHQQQKTTLLEFYQKVPQKNQEWVLCSLIAVLLLF